MSFKVAAAVAVLALASLAGCAAQNSEDAAANDSDIVAAPVKVQGAWRAKAGTATSSQWFEGAYFANDGTFFADVNNGLMCITTPCPTTTRITGTYAVVGRNLLLTSRDATDSSAYYARYTISRGGANALTIKGDGFSNTLEAEGSYCSEAADCGGQPLIRPACAPGHDTCSAQNTCGFACGTPPVVAKAIWPSDRKVLVAETRGGGFAPPAPAGSACAIGAAKYTLDLAAKTISWEVCKIVDWQTAFTKDIGSRALTPADVTAMNAAMGEVKIAEREICGADKPMLEITVTSPSQGTRTYTDSFYSCLGAERTYVDNIDAVFGAFREIAR